jgi:hypothetical protein
MSLVVVKNGKTEENVTVKIPDSFDTEFFLKRRKKYLQCTQLVAKMEAKTEDENLSQHLFFGGFNQRKNQSRRKLKVTNQRTILQLAFSKRVPVNSEILCQKNDITQNSKELHCLSFCCRTYVGRIIDCVVATVFFDSCWLYFLTLPPGGLG